MMNSLQWNEIIASLRYPHILQSYQWGEFKSGFGWKPTQKIWEESGKPVAAALVLERTLSLKGLSSSIKILYVPKGPLLLDWEDSVLRKRVLDDLIIYARHRHAIFIKIDPDVKLGSTPSDNLAEIKGVQTGDKLVQDLQKSGWMYSNEQIQFRNTIQLDLSLKEEELLGKMKQKTRYNIRLAQRKGVVVRVASQKDIPLLYQMYAETARRDQFIIRHEQYYRKAWEVMLPITEAEAPSWQIAENGTCDIKHTSNQPTAEALIAEVDGEPVAAVIYYHFADKAWYFYGMSRDNHREKMPNYLLQWEAIRSAKNKGLKTLDFWGAPERFNDKDPLWGVLRFKAGFGGEYIRHIGAWDCPIRPLFYTLYTGLLPKVLDILRKQSKNHLLETSG